MFILLQRGTLISKAERGLSCVQLLLVGYLTTLSVCTILWQAERAINAFEGTCTETVVA